MTPMYDQSSLVNDASARADEAEQEAAEYRRIGDLMQSEASRLLEWADATVKAHPTTVEMPYEVRMAMFGVQDAIARWTAARIDYAPSSPFTRNDR